MIEFTNAFNSSSRFGNKLLIVAGACIVGKKLNLYIPADQCLTLGGWLLQHAWKNDFLNNFSINEDYLKGEKINEPTINIDADWVSKNLDVSLWQRGRYLVDESSLTQHQFIVKYGSEYKNVFNITQPIICKEGVFVHFRGGDQQQPSVGTYEFYKEALTRLNAKTGHLSTDGMSLNHPMVNQLAQEFNLTKVPFEYSPVQTLMFARGFKDMVLDRGSYSWWLGTIGQPKRVFCYVPPVNYSWGANTHLAHPNWVPLTL